MYVNSIPILNVQSAQQLEFLAYSMFLFMLVGILFAILGLRQFLNAFRRTDHSTHRTLRAAARMFERKRYRRVMAAVTLTYGAVFAFISGMIVFSPLESFRGEYQVVIPSAVVAVCCGSAGLTPVLTIFLTDHLGVLLIPMDVVLVVLVSGLVGLNATLILCQYDNRPRSGLGRWLLGVGAACGLFTACPTCAGLLLSSVILGLGASAIAVLSSMQLFFVLGSALALVLGAVLSARMLVPGQTLELAAANVD
jgi:hypothetical protein